jgi:hypothetical protein
MLKKMTLSAMAVIFVSLWLTAAAAAAVPLSAELQKEVDYVKEIMTAAGLTGGEFDEQRYLPPVPLGDAALQVKVGASVPTTVLNLPCGSNVDFSFDSGGFISRVNSMPSKKTDCTGVTFHSMHHAIIFSWDASRIALKNAEGSDKQNLAFNFVTDPTTLSIITVAFFTFKYKSLAGDEEQKWFYAIEGNRVLVYDEVPPDAVLYSDRVFFTTTGGKMSEFNKRAEEYGLTEHPKNSISMEFKNPGEIAVYVKDNNFFASDKSGNLPATGFRYGTTQPDIAFYVETYKAFYKESDNPSSSNKLERVLGETVDSSALGGNPATPEGRFGWIGPIWFSDLQKYGWKFDKKASEIVEDSSGSTLINPVVENGIIVNKDKCVTVFTFTGPLDAIEKAVAEKAGDPEAMRYSLHFASLAQMYIPVSASDNFRFLEHQFNDEALGFKDEKMLRICTAVLDSSGNLRMPWLSRAIDEKKVLGDFQAKYGVDKLSKAGLCDEMMVVVPYDDRLPGAVLSVTNTETNITTAFTIPNYDCLTKENTDAGSEVYFPFAEQAEVWHFKYDGDTEAMKWLKLKDPKRYDEYIKALTINEDVRLIFDMIGYDNVNKYFETLDSDKKKIGQYGISTEMAGGEKGLESLYYRTWRIDDPTGTESLMYEDKAQNLFVYPDYVFRNPEQGKVYKVSFIVEDFSPFFNRKGSAVVPQPDPRSGNIRQIILEFDVKGRAVQSQSMGGTTTTTNTILDKGNGGSKENK